jgi:hemolysin activation/secretion protein
VSLEEETPWWVRLEADNYESQSTGGTAGRVRFGHENVLGLGDRLFASASFTEAVDADPPPRGSYSAGYEIPVTASDTALGLSYDYGESKVVESPSTTSTSRATVDRAFDRVSPC